uniref:Uncharacterized protein n=1 Tax=Cacopsylla melanoneura TaxID=428564 RepID=A0A8D8U2W4_9HEMI
MDVFGNSSYIPNQSQWSQTGFMPTLNSFTSTNTTNTWSQTPPNNVPWGISYSQALPNVIRFTGQSDVSFPHHNSISSSSSHLQIKRHLDDSDDDSLDSSTVLSKPPAKQFITEEKMAAKMNEMHISNAFTRFYQEPQSQSSYQHSCLLHRSNTNCCTSATTSTLSSSHLQPNATEEDTSFNMMDDTNDNLNNNRSGSNNFNKSSCSNNFNNTPSNNNGQMPSLYLSEELKRLSCSIDPVIPKDLLQRNLNSQALVLWQPRIGLGAFPWSTESTPQEPSSPESSEDEAEFIRSDDPACNVVITEITEPNHRTEEAMAVDDL